MGQKSQPKSTYFRLSLGRVRFKNHLASTYFNVGPLNNPKLNGAKIRGSSKSLELLYIWNLVSLLVISPKIGNYAKICER